ncbi:MAG: SH3 domain-containing protein [Anaerolineae bacterium]|nr:SH3 domain-containing protein [Anaerolineae bacterium]
MRYTFTTSKRKIQILLLTMLILLLAGISHAQDLPQPSDRAIVLSTQNGLTIAEMPLPGPSYGISFSGANPAQYARIDQVGMIRFVPPGETGETVYGDSPYFNGFTKNSPQENELLVREVDMAPAGQHMAFRILNDAIDSISRGVWFWQPERFYGTDPSYQVLRVCPPFCDATGAAPGQTWQALSVDWAPDGSAMLIHIDLTSENRRALEIRYPIRGDENLQAITAPNPLRYDYGTWSIDPTRLIVSGTGPNGNAVFGNIGIDGSSPIILSASDIGLIWVQNAAQTPSGQLVMLGGQNAQQALALYDDSGTQLTDPIGTSAPAEVEWSPDRTAVRLLVDGRTYIAQIDGTITDITDMVASTPNIAWVSNALPPSAIPLSVTPTAETAVPPATIAADPATQYEVGALLQVVVPDLTLYAEPAADALAIGTLQLGEEVIITSDPLSDQNGNTWWRVQTLNYSGWIVAERDGQPTLGFLSG